MKSNGNYNLVQLRTHLQEEGILDTTAILEMSDRFTNIISILWKQVENEPNILTINTPVTIIGDIHGQYYDFLKILTKIKNVEETLTTNILFLGDYVDRGVNSVEVITFIMALKINNPKRVYMLRGNHESRCMTHTYNFMKEVTSKYNQSIY
jgi:serine/threonine-protein phosphatase 2B catalytic subunit